MGDWGLFMTLSPKGWLDWEDKIEQNLYSFHIVSLRVIFDFDNFQIEMESFKNLSLWGAFGGKV